MSEEQYLDSGGDESSDSEQSYEYIEDSEEEGKIDANDAPMPCNKPGKVNMNLPYTVSREALFDLIRCQIETVCNVCGLPEGVALILLHMNDSIEGNSRFRAEEVITRWMYPQKGQRSTEELLKFLYLSEIPCKMSIATSKELVCGVCFAPADEDDVDFISLGCDHYYCRDCWVRYCGDKVEENDIFRIRCMEPSCKIAPSFQALRDILCDSTGVATQCQDRLIDRYVVYLVNAMVQGGTAEGRADFNPCPNPGCPEITFIPPNCSTGRVECLGCDFAYCSMCLQESHSPSTCVDYREWKKKEESESMSTQWIVLNTKECPNPKCAKPIEKNGGCSHMTCRRCKHEFCWLCMGDYRNHSNCNRLTQKKETGLSELRSELKRYHFYWDRYSKHLASQKFETKLKQTVEENATKIEMQGYAAFAKGQVDVDAKSSAVVTDISELAGVISSLPISSSAPASAQEGHEIGLHASMIDTEYLLQGVKTLINCRRTLKFTYLHAYYLKSGRELELFEYLQGELERATEDLAELLEKTPGAKAKILSQKTVATSRREKLLEGTEAGLIDSSALAVPLASFPEASKKHAASPKSVLPPVTSVPVEPSISNFQDYQGESDDENVEMARAIEASLKDISGSKA